MTEHRFENTDEFCSGPIGELIGLAVLPVVVLLVALFLLVRIR